MASSDVGGRRGRKLSARGALACALLGGGTALAALLVAGARACCPALSARVLGATLGFDPWAQHPTPACVRVVIRNELGVDAVLWHRALEASWDGVYLDARLARPLVGSDHDCRLHAPYGRCDLGPAGTLAMFFELPRRRPSLTLYMGVSSAFMAGGTVWLQPRPRGERVQPTASGPQLQSVIAYSACVQPVPGACAAGIGFELDLTRGFSAGLAARFEPDARAAARHGGRPSRAAAAAGSQAERAGAEARCTPARFEGDELLIQISRTPYGHAAVLSDGSTHPVDGCECPALRPDARRRPWEAAPAFNASDPRCAAAACLASCPEPIAASACGQHACRGWNAAHSYTDRRGYCGWLQHERCAGRCWALDDLLCVDGACGWGARRDGSRPSSCADADAAVALAQDRAEAARAYSCGTWHAPHGWPAARAAGASAGSGGAGSVGRWWPTQASAGCVPKPAASPSSAWRAPLAPGTLTLEFRPVPWLPAVGEGGSSSAAQAGRMRSERLRDRPGWR